ncbi:hypothetical protein [Pseudomonas sp. SWRI18]|uniref:hypothetical protein n=1 Tax=Pseudomonas sp. SWRI18 TaxID=2753888 RepID=UPI001EE16434|nr:hypothetical protein [Pseudomonas sp. SWRI18]
MSHFDVHVHAPYRVFSREGIGQSNNTHLQRHLPADRWNFKYRLIWPVFTVKNLRTFNTPSASKRSQGMRSVENNPPQFTRIPVAAIGVGLGLAVAIYTTGKGPFFLENFAYTWLPQAAVLCIALLCKASRI